MLAALLEFRIIGSSVLLHQSAVLRVAAIGNASLLNTQGVRNRFRELAFREHKDAFLQAYAPTHKNADYVSCSDGAE